MADPWAAFDAPQQAPAAVQAAPSGDPWAAFDAPATTAPATPARDPNAYEYIPPPGTPGRAAWEADIPAPPVDPRRTGYVANVAAGPNEVITGAAGFPVDAATLGINTLAAGVNRVAGTNIPPITNPVGGSHSLNTLLGYMGANPEDVRPEGLGQLLARGAAGGLASTFLPSGVMGLAARTGVASMPTAARTVQALGAPTSANMAISATAGAGGEVARDMAPDWAKPIAGLVGGMATGGGLIGLVGGIRGGYNALSRYAAPAMGRAAPILDATGAPVVGSGGVPLTATPNVRQMAGRQLLADTQDPAAVRAVVEAPPEPMIPGDRPTLGRMTGDPGLAAAELAISQKGTATQQGAFKAQIDAQNDARVRLLRSQEAGADPMAADAALKQRIAETDAAGAARVADAQARASGTVAATEAQTQARVAGLQGTAATARDAVGGDLPSGSDAQVGAALRAPVSAAREMTRNREGALWDAVDPEGTLAVDIRPVREGARAITGDRSPNARPLAGEEAGIFQAARELPNVQSFRDLQELRGRLTTAIRQERGDPKGDPQAVRRMSMLLDNVHTAMDAGLDGKVAADAAAVRAGAMRPEDAINARLSAEADRANTANPAGTGLPPEIPGGTPNAGTGQGGGAAADRGGVGNGPGGGGGGPGDSALAALAANPGRRPLTIRERVIQMGGVRPNADYLANDLDKVHHQGGGRLLNPNGLPEDYVRKILSQPHEGYLPPNSDINDLRNKLTSKQDEFPISQQADVLARRLEARQKRDGATLEADALYNARDRVNTASETMGVRLSQAERDHAVELHLNGRMSPADAIHDAVRSGEEPILQRNAEQQAGRDAARESFGAPGVAPGARQAEMPVTAQQPQSVPNFDAAAAARYAAARAATAERVATFKDAPGVGQALQSGPTSGSFKAPDSAVPNIIVRAGPAGRDVATAYLKAGGSPEALSDAAAYSLRQFPGARRADGSLDPAKVTAWANQRGSFLSAIPEAAARFRAVAEAQRAADAGTAEGAATLKRVTAEAKTMVDDAMARRGETMADLQRSAVGRFMGEGDPVARVWSVVNDRATGQARARQLMDAVRGDPAAEAGLRRTVMEGVERNHVGNTMGITSEQGNLRANAYQNFLTHSEPALREILTPDQVDGMKRVAAMMERDNRSARVGTNSVTTQLMAGDGRGLAGKVGEKLFGLGGGASLGAAIGGWVGGGIGATAGSAIGVAIAHVVQAAREAGIQNAADLRTEAYLNPPLYRLLTTNVTPSNRASLLGALRAQLFRSALSGATQGKPDRQDKRK